MVVPAGESHAYGSDPDQPWTLHWFHAMGAHLPRWLEYLGVNATSPVLHLGRAAELEALFREMREALEGDYSEQQLLYATQALAHSLGVMLRMSRSTPRTAHSAQRRVLTTLEHMKGHLTASLELCDLAALAELSPSHYSELVKDCTGYPPMEYLSRLRMHRAAQLLDTTELPIKAIARAVGFADPLHFSRVFRRINERSPRQYRADRAQGILEPRDFA